MVPENSLNMEFPNVFNFGHKSPFSDGNFKFFNVTQHDMLCNNSSSLTNVALKIVSTDDFLFTSIRNLMQEIDYIHICSKHLSKSILFKI